VHQWIGSPIDGPSIDENLHVMQRLDFLLIKHLYIYGCIFQNQFALLNSIYNVSVHCAEFIMGLVAWLWINGWDRRLNF